MSSPTPEAAKNQAGIPQSPTYRANTQNWSDAAKKAYYGNGGQ